MKKTVIVIVTLTIALAALFWMLRYFGLSCDDSCSVPQATSSGEVTG